MSAETRLTQQVADRLLKAMLVFSRTVDHVLENRVFEASGESLSTSKVQILRLLGRHGSQTATQLALFLGTSKPAVTQMIDAMVRARLVSRRKSTHDRRGVVLRLTLKGRNCFRRVLEEQRHLVRSAARLAAGGDVEEWIETLQDVAGALARADRAFQQFCLQCAAHADGSCVLVGGDANCLFLRHHGRAASRRRRGTTPAKR